MPIRNRQYEKRTVNEIFNSSVEELLTLEPNANPTSTSTYTYALLLSQARTINQNQEQSLQSLYNAAYVEDATGEELTKKARNLGIIRRDAERATGVVEFSRESAATTDYVIPSGTQVETLDTDPIQFETTESVTLTSGTTSVQANIQAVQAGQGGNVGANSISALPSPPTGVGSVTNANPTGDTTLTDTNGDPLRAGRDREEDDNLRSRVLDTDATDEGPSPSGIKLALEQTDGVISADLNSNQTGSTVDGIDPYKTEVVVYGGTIQDIGDTLYQTMSVTTLLRLQGGVNGTLDSIVKYVGLLDEDVTIEITRPNIDQLTLEIDVVHTSEYEGTVPAKDAVVDYVGGTFADDSTTNGSVIGEDVLVNEIENVIEDTQGVDWANVTLLDVDGDGTDDTTTTANGVPIYSVDSSSLARVDADDITLTETQK